MTDNLKRFQISCPVFWGFNRFVDISKANSINDCINLFLQTHREFLFEQNYIDLLNYFDAHKSEYHIHDLTFDDIKNTNEIIYVCRHCQETENSESNLSENVLENNLNKDQYKNSILNLY